MDLRVHSVKTLNDNLDDLLATRGFSNFYKVIFTKEGIDKHLPKKLLSLRRVESFSRFEIIFLFIFLIVYNFLWFTTLDGYKLITTNHLLGTMHLVYTSLVALLLIYLIVNKIRYKSYLEKTNHKLEELEKAYIANFRPSLERYALEGGTTYAKDCLAADILLSLAQLDIEPERIDLTGSEKGTAIRYFLSAQVKQSEGSTIEEYINSLNPEVDLEENKFVKIDIHKDDDKYGWFFCLKSGVYGYTDSEGIGEITTDGKKSTTVHFTVPVTPQGILDKV